LIRRLRAGEISGAALEVDDRRACVEYLTSEGYSVAEIAGILTVADRTVLRDRKAVRSANAVARDESLVTEMVGHLIKEADTAVGRLRRVGRDKSAPASVKVDAERAAWLVTREMIILLQRLGYLPEAARELRANLTHRLGGGGDDQPPEIDELAQEIERLQSIQAATGAGDAALVSGLIEAREALLRLAVGDQLKVLAGAMEAPPGAGSEAVDEAQD